MSSIIVCRDSYARLTNRTGGTDYPGDTLHEIIICLQMYIDTIHTDRGYKLLSDSRFSQIKNTVDHEMRSRARRGLVCDKRQPLVITTDEEDILWNTHVLGDDNPNKLVATLFYFIGLNFALRGGQEHRDLRVGINSQLKVMTSNSGRRYLQYTEDVSKSN